MKRLFYLLTAVMVLILSCQPKTKVVQVDLNAAKAEVSQFLDEYYNAMHSKDVSSISQYFTDNALILGTDPKEFWSKDETIKMMTQMFADTSLKLNYTIDKREILVEKSGNAAIAIEQMTIPFISKKIPCRCTYHLVKNEVGWQFDFTNSSLIPFNEDLSKINKSLE